jgi:hypothetical protein
MIIVSAVAHLMCRMKEDETTIVALTSYVIGPGRQEYGEDPLRSLTQMKLDDVTQNLPLPMARGTSSNASVAPDSQLARRPDHLVVVANCNAKLPTFAPLHRMLSVRYFSDDDASVAFLLIHRMIFQDCKIGTKHQLKATKSSIRIAGWKQIKLVFGCFLARNENTAKAHAKSMDDPNVLVSHHERGIEVDRLKWSVLCHLSLENVLYADLVDGVLVSVEVIAGNRESPRRRKYGRAEHWVNSLVERVSLMNKFFEKGKISLSTYQKTPLCHVLALSGIAH